MGEVYRAKDTKLGREVAIKVLPGAFLEDEDRRTRFEREARTLASLNHPGIAAIYSFEEISGPSGSPSRHALVQELLEGETLRQALAAGKLPLRKAVDWAIQIAEGLSAAHGKGIVHRDLKPENLFVTTDGRIKILDFGLAKLAEDALAGPGSNLPTASRGTEPGVVLGTLGYMSPEQLRGKPADARSDIFSFGAILYEMLSGWRAFRGDSAADTMSAILKEEPPELSLTGHNVSTGLERIVRHCLEKNPEQRFHSAHDLAFNLKALPEISAPTVGTPVSGSRPMHRSKAMWLVGGAILLIAVAATVMVFQRSRARPIDSLAVLPFANASSDPNVEYLGDGITDALINSLSQLPNLTVMSRDAVSDHKGPDVSAQAAGRDLKVQAVLKGKFVQRAQDLLVSAELVDVRDNSHLWGGQFNRKLSDIQSIQEEITGQISSKLRARLTGEEKKRLTKRYTQDPEAYQLYLKGRYLWEKRTEEPLKKSIEYFNQAIEKDPGYALAYVGLAEAYAVSTSYSFLSPGDAIPKSKAAIGKALEIDDNLAGAHRVFGWALSSYDWDYAAAEMEFEKALTLDPRDSTAHHWYGLLLISLGRTDEAVAQLQRARELAPFQEIIQANVTRAYAYAHQYDRALEEGRKAADNFAPAHNRKAEAYLAKGVLEKAAAEYQKAADLFKGNPLGLLSLGMAQALGGRRSEALKTIDEMKTLAAQRYVSPAYVAQIYGGLGDKVAALQWLEKAYEDHSWDLIFLRVNPQWDLLRSDPRFGDLLRRVKLSP
jgi:serine/threonine protein kinase/tetratricopeptide (TPR) repeat protein